MVVLVNTDMAYRAIEGGRQMSAWKRSNGDWDVIRWENRCAVPITRVPTKNDAILVISHELMSQEQLLW